MTFKPRSLLVVGAVCGLSLIAFVAPAASAAPDQLPSTNPSSGLRPGERKVSLPKPSAPTPHADRRLLPEPKASTAPVCTPVTKDAPAGTAIGVGVRRELCVTRRASPATTATGKARAKAAAPGQVPCSNAEPRWVVARFSLCQDFLQLTTTLIERPSNTILGQAIVNIAQNSELNLNSTSWQEKLYFTMVDGWGRLSEMRYGIQAYCGSLCTNTVTPTMSTRMVAGQSSSAVISYTASPVTQFSYPVKYTIQMLAGTEGTPNAAQYEAPLGGDFRCDRLIGRYAGCVYPYATPTFFVSIQNWAASAVMIQYAQSVLVDHWGRDTPMSRLHDNKIKDINRKAMCKDGTWVADPRVQPQDSCDEFPFAGSWESGAMFGLTGANCAQVRPFIDPASGLWVIGIYGAITYAERCIRGHVNLLDNEGVGGDLGRYAQAQRLLDRDSYYVEVVP